MSDKVFENSIKLLTLLMVLWIVAGILLWLNVTLVVLSGLVLEIGITIVLLKIWGKSFMRRL
ncbi:MAG: hypothetical protein U1D67_01100 [Dehalococcoidia bacterium]|nr:hypothetical protein [Dehalococcoidia bacterium]MDZ4245695.1 hypothetical protein [Dehalococcoidia bacterium]